MWRQNFITFVTMIMHISFLGRLSDYVRSICRAETRGYRGMLLPELLFGLGVTSVLKAWYRVAYSRTL